MAKTIMESPRLSGDCRNRPSRPNPTKYMMMMMMMMRQIFGKIIISIC